MTTPTHTPTPPHQPNNLRIDPSTIAQTCVIAALVGLTTTVLQLRQDVSILTYKISNLTLNQEFAAFKATTEQKLQELENKINDRQK
jgi:hypothetical protein